MQDWHTLSEVQVRHRDGQSLHSFYEIYVGVTVEYVISWYVLDGHDVRHFLVVVYVNRVEGQAL